MSELAMTWIRSGSILNMVLSARSYPVRRAEFANLPAFDPSLLIKFIAVNLPEPKIKAPNNRSLGENILLRGFYRIIDVGSGNNLQTSTRCIDEQKFTID